MNWLNLVQALAGSFIVLKERNDTVEGYLGLTWRTAAWVSLELILALLCFGPELSDTYPPLEAGIRTFIGLLLVGYILTMGHGFILDSWEQKYKEWSETSGTFCLRIALFITRGQHIVGERMGLPVWLLANFFRYVLPCALLGYVVNEPWQYAAGLLIIFAYYPLAWWKPIKSRFDTRFFGAAACGFIFYGLL